MNITLSKEIIDSIVFTLKGIDVRGYDSMSKLVGTVTLLENLLARANQLAQQEAEEAEEKNGEGGTQEV